MISEQVWRETALSMLAGLALGFDEILAGYILFEIPSESDPLEYCLYEYDRHGQHCATWWTEYEGDESIPVFYRSTDASVPLSMRKPGDGITPPAYWAWIEDPFPNCEPSERVNMDTVTYILDHKATVCAAQ